MPPKRFWQLVRDQVVDYVSEPPLTGRFKGSADTFLLSINHTILDLTCPEHRAEVLHSKRQVKKRAHLRLTS